MGAKTAADVDPRFAEVVEAFSGERGVSVNPGWGKGNATLTLRDKIFALLLRDGLVAKLPRPRVDELVAEGRGTRFDPRRNGSVMKEWLVSTEEREWIALAREAHAHVAMLASTRAKPSATRARRSRAR